MAASYSGTVTNGSGILALPEALLNVYSADIEHAAQPVLMFEEFVVHKTELQTQPGKTIMITRYDGITRGGALTEGVPMEAKSLTASQISITVGEFGNMVGVTEFLLRTSFDDVMKENALQLGLDYAKVRNIDIRDALTTAANTTLYTTPGAVSIATQAGTDTFDIEAIRVAVETLATKNVPKFDNNFYVCFLHPHQASYLKRDPDWINAHNYANDRALFNGEIGRWENVIFIESTIMPNGVVASTDDAYEAALDGTGVAGANLYRALLFGDMAVGLADALPVELRDGGIIDVGRTHVLAWYAIWGVDELNGDNIVTIISG